MSPTGMATASQLRQCPPTEGWERCGATSKWEAKMHLPAARGTR